MKKYRYLILDIISFIIIFELFLFPYEGDARHREAIIMGIMLLGYLSFYYSEKYIKYLQERIDGVKKILIIRISRTLIILVPALLICVLYLLFPNRDDELYIRFVIFWVTVAVCLILRLKSLLKKLKKADEL